MPTLDFLIKLYNEPNTYVHQQYVRWSLKKYAPKMYIDFASEDYKILMPLVVNNFMHFWGHQMIYNFPLLRAMLKDVGFENITESKIGTSEHTYLRGLENHGNVIPPWANELESMTVEARK